LNEINDKKTIALKISIVYNKSNITTINQQYYSKQQAKYYNKIPSQILQVTRQQQAGYYNNKPAILQQVTSQILQQNIKAQPGSRAHFSVIYQSRPMAKYQSQPMAKYQSQPIKVSSIIENHRFRSEEPKSTQTAVSEIK
jgi:hypothetical protein